MPSNRDVDVAEELGALKANVEHLTRYIRQLEAECKERDKNLQAEINERLTPLEGWKKTCDMLAWGWATIILIISTLVATCVGYWDSISKFVSKVLAIWKGAGQ